MFISSTPQISEPLQTFRSTGGHLGSNGVYAASPKLYTHNHTTGDLSLSNGLAVIKSFQLDGVATAIEVARYIDFTSSVDIEAARIAGQAADPGATPPIPAVDDVIVDYIETSGVLTSIKVGAVTYTWEEAYSLAGYIRSTGVGTPYAPSVP